MVGRNILDSLHHRRSSLELIAMNSVAKEPSIFEYDKVYLSPSLVENPSEFREFFDQVVLEEKPDLVIPCRDEDVAFLSRINPNDSFNPSRFLCGPASIADSFLDKWESWKFSQELNLPFAPTLNSDASSDSFKEFVTSQGLPLIAKPRKGFGSLGVFLISHENQLSQVIERDDYVVQKYLGDPERVSLFLGQIAERGLPLFHTFEETKLSVQASIGPNGEFGGMIITEHAMKQGISARVDLCEDKDLYNLAENWVKKIAEAGWVGPINIQCQRDPSGQIMIYEYNGRFTGATSARYWLGYDELGRILNLWLQAKMRDDLKESPHHTVVRIPGSKPLNGENVQELNFFKIWNQPSATKKSVIGEL